MSEPNKRDIEAPEKDERDSLFRLITEEIKDLNEADKLKGWTPWILSATLISMIWIIVQDVWNERPSGNPIQATFVVVSLTILGIHDVRRIFISMSPDSDKKGRFQFIHTSADPLSIFVLGLWLGSIAVACLTLRIAE